jgi:hypothetical protein
VGAGKKWPGAHTYPEIGCNLPHSFFFRSLEPRGAHGGGQREGELSNSVSVCIQGGVWGGRGLHQRAHQVLQVLDDGADADGGRREQHRRRQSPGTLGAGRAALQALGQQAQTVVSFVWHLFFERFIG